MKNLGRQVSPVWFVVAVLLYSALLAGATVSAAERDPFATDWKKGKLSRLVPLVGTYRFEQVFEDPDVKRAMQEQLGGDLPHFLKNVDVRSAIEFRSSDIVLRGNRAHEAHRERAILVVNIHDGKAHAGIFSEGKTTIYSKANAYLALPIPIREWVRFDAYGDLLETKPSKNFTWIKEK